VEKGTEHSLRTFRLQSWYSAKLHLISNI
jgi:hypothetical protein